MCMLWQRHRQSKLCRIERAFAGVKRSMSESKTKGELPDFIGYSKWNPKKKRFDHALWKNPRKNQEASKA